MNTAILHYSVPPTIGGVEAVIDAHTRLLLGAGYTVRVIAGLGDQSAMPPGVDFIHIPKMDSRHPQVIQASEELKKGTIPENFGSLTAELQDQLTHALESMDNVIIHNIFSKHFNLPLTAALARLLDQGRVKNCILWTHDLTWTSPHSRPFVHPGYPWDLLRTYREDVTYITVSRFRQQELAGLFGCTTSRIKVIYNGVDPAKLYSLSPGGQKLIEKLDFETADLFLLMPVRITQAKNIELAFNVVDQLKMNGFHPRLVITGPPDTHDNEGTSYYRKLLELRKQLGVEQEARFVYELGLHLENGYKIGSQVVTELYRTCDVLFMPSHREGFGMPILEAGLIGIPIFSTDIPATEEIGQMEVIRIPHDAPAEHVAQLIQGWADSSKIYKLRTRIRKHYTWQAIFKQDILPLLTRGKPS